MVTFSRIPYKKCLQDKRWQDSVIEIGGKVCAFAFITAFAFNLWKHGYISYKQLAIHF